MDDVAAAIANFNRGMSTNVTAGIAPANSTIVATWNQQDAVDANLSIITLPGGQVARFVPKLASVTGLSAGDRVIVQCGPNNTYYILGKLLGDVTIANAQLPIPDVTPPTTPSSCSVGSPTSSTLTVSWGASTDSSGIQGYDVYYSSGQLAGSTTSLSLTITGLAASTTYFFYVKARDTWGNVSSASNTASNTTSAAAAPPAASTYTRQYAAIWSGTYNYKSSGEFDSWYGTQCNQGRSSGGNTKSMIGFSSALIVADGAGFTTAVNAWITLTFGHWWYNSGGTAVIGTNAEAGRPGHFTGSSDRLRSGSWGRGERRTVSLGAGICNEFLTAGTRGINLGPGPTTDVLYYGWAYGYGTGANQPVLTLQYVK